MVVESYWPELKPHIPKFFKGIDVKPSLLHGNLWIENAAQFNSKPGLVFINVLQTLITNIY